MPFKMSFFKRIMVLMLVLLIPVMFLYSYSYKTSIMVIQNEIEASSIRQLNFFLSQVENTAAQLALHTITLSNESSVREIGQLDQVESLFTILKTKKTIEDKLLLYSSSSSWRNSISIFSPVTGVTLSTYPVIEYEMPELQENLITRWTFDKKDKLNPDDRFTWYTTSPPSSRYDLSSANLIVETSFTTDNLKNMLDEFVTTRKGNPFFYKAGFDPITNRQGNAEHITELIRYFQNHTPSNEGSYAQVSIAGKPYLVSSVPSTVLGWYLIDFVPLDEVLSPMYKSRNLFFSVMLILLILGTAMSFFLYRNVQIPIRELINNVQKLKRGDYSARLSKQPKNEFHFLFSRFNEMAAEIQELIEKVYAEKLRSREATLKQLQSQINPHFFYNCLFFIVSMSRLGENKAVEAMATNLGDYYRYTTRVERQTSSLKEELGLVNNYLTIQQLRQQIDYEIHIPPEMLDLPIPRLLLQPLVENAIIHGLEPLDGDGRITIHMEINRNRIDIVVEDSGVGMTDIELQELRNKCSEPLTEEMGCGVWNVHQRLIYMYGDGSGLLLDHSELGGLKAVLSIRRDEPNHV
ncbi:two-component system, sensor histidine kinase YesM [Paenibacillus sp. 1_12]|uniref:sensor histidine kinase n=1 Tax=Paenibacillus sp. 1_12 TaxID=1566278 RepID=UPI0008E18E6E|nr:histidine kinase [Paenibacillus sp. 1_12]SFK95708.1 two-component system, sensor histidine kinase YesM [Paenibacillus sp. 1_12]